MSNIVTQLALLSIIVGLQVPQKLYDMTLSGGGEWVYV